MKVAARKTKPFPLSTAMRKTMKGYGFSTFRQDAMAAFVVSLLALPLSMALSIAVGLPPQHGLYTAIVAGAIVPLLGGSVSQVSGPTAAFVVILAPIVAELGLRGIIWCGLLAGVVLILFGFVRLGRLINYVPFPVTTGFTAGIAAVLATLSLNDFLGLGIAKLEGSFVEKAYTILSYLPSLNPYECAVGIATLLLIIYSGRVVRVVPGAIIAVLAGTGLALLFAHYGHDVETVGVRFSYLDPDGATHAGIPPYPPMFHWPVWEGHELFTIPDLTEFRQLLFPALAIAILAALESLLSATVADSMAGTKHDPNAELTAIGIGNVLSALASGIPATGAIARTAVNLNNGARTPLASSMHAVLVMVYVMLLAPYMSYLPMASLAAILIHTAYRMSHLRQFIRIIEIAPRSDVIVLLTCFLLTVFIDMVAGVGIGMICAAFLLIKRVMDLTHVELEGNAEEGSMAAPRTLPHGTMVYRIRGPLFFGTIEKAFDQAGMAQEGIDNFIVDITGVPFIDMTGLVAMRSMLESIANEKRAVHVVSNTPEVLDKIRQKIKGSRAHRHVHFHATIEGALHHKKSIA